MQEKGDKWDQACWKDTARTPATATTSVQAALVPRPLCFLSSTQSERKIPLKNHKELPVAVLDQISTPPGYWELLELTCRNDRPTGRCPFQQQRRCPKQRLYQEQLRLLKIVRFLSVRMALEDLSHLCLKSKLRPAIEAELRDTWSKKAPVKCMSFQQRWLIRGLLGFHLLVMIGLLSSMQGKPRW